MNGTDAVRFDRSRKCWLKRSPAGGNGCKALVDRGFSLIIKVKILTFRSGRSPTADKFLPEMGSETGIS